VGKRVRHCSLKINYSGNGCYLFDHCTSSNMTALVYLLLICVDEKEWLVLRREVQLGRKLNETGQRLLTVSKKPNS